MEFFEKKPIRRLIFLVGYLSFGILALLSYTIVTSIIVLVVVLFGTYMTVVKSGLRSDSNARNIRNYRFDFISIVLTVYSLWKLACMVL